MEQVVVTGLGVVSALGMHLDEFFLRCCAGKDAASLLDCTNSDKYRKRAAAPIKAPLPIPSKWARYGRSAQMALLAAQQSLRDAGMTTDYPADIGISLGTMNGGAVELEDWFCSAQERELCQAPRELFEQFPLHASAQAIAKEFGLSGIQDTAMTACASGSAAIAKARDWILRGRAELVLCGGTDAFRRLTHLGLAAFRIVAREKCRPFDQSRDGILIGEGAGMLLLESESSARRRKARIYAYVAGAGYSCDANDLAHPLQNGEGMFLAMKRALESGGKQASDLDYINAHGTGTQKNDSAECAAIEKLLSGTTKKVYVNSLKGALGHTIGAAGGIEAVATVLSLYHDTIFPNANYTRGVHEDTVLIPKQKIHTNIHCALSNSFGFGGNNTSILFSKWEG